jgi:hypothetical protein
MDVEAEELKETCPQNAISSDLCDTILDMYEQPEVATVIPDRKSVKKDLVPKAVLNKTLKSLHKVYFVVQLFAEI